MKRWAVLVLMFLSSAASAAPDTSLRPVLRPFAEVKPDATGAIVPPPRDSAAKAAARRGAILEESPRPRKRPSKVKRIARQAEKLKRRGAVCNDLEIQGEAVGRVSGSKSGCGVKNAVRVRSVSGIELSQSSVMDCGTATALKSWVEKTAKPVFARHGGGLKRLRVAAHYACRTRNNKPGGRISEHGKGRAIDISGVRLRDGTLVTVLNGWKGRQTGPLLKKLHKGACGPFGTVLGPDSDRFHRDHFHFDTARYRSGPYCR